jgi:hypothetical protein
MAFLGVKLLHICMKRLGILRSPFTVLFPVPVVGSPANRVSLLGMKLFHYDTPEE